MKKWYEFAADKFEKQVKPDLIGKYLIANDSQPITVMPNIDVKYNKIFSFQILVYLRCPIDILRERIKSRGRPEEQTMNWTFLEEMQRRYDDYLMYQNTSFPVPSKVVVLDGSLTIPQFTPYVHAELPHLFPSWKLRRSLQRRKNKRGKKY